MEGLLSVKMQASIVKKAEKFIFVGSDDNKDL